MIRLILYLIFVSFTISISNSQDQIKIAAIKQDGKWGVIDEHGKIIVPCKYEDIGVNCNELILAKWNGKYGYINGSGKVIIANAFDEAGIFTEEFAYVKRNGKFGYIDKKGKKVIDFLYEEAKNYSDKLAPVKHNGKWGFVNSKNKIVVPFIYSEVLPYYNNYAIVKDKDRKVGVIDKTGNIVLPIENEGIFYGFNNNFVVLRKEISDSVRNIFSIRWGLVDVRNNIIIPFNYKFIEFDPGNIFDGLDCNSIFPFSNKKNILVQDINSMFGIMDDKGNRISCCFLQFHLGGNGYYAFEKIKDSYYDDPKWCILDSIGNLVLDTIYGEVGEVNEGIVQVWKAGKWGYYDLGLKSVIIDFLYDQATPFYKGKSLVLKNGILYLIDKNQTIISTNIPFDLDTKDFMPLFHNKFIVLKKGDKFGAIDYDGNVILSPVYDNPVDFDYTNIHYYR